MHAVINHLRFTDPIDPTSFDEIPSLQEQLTSIAGFHSLLVVQTGEHEATFLILADTQESLDQISREVGSPWVTRTILPLLNAPPDRRVGRILVTAAREAQ